MSVGSAYPSSTQGESAPAREPISQQSTAPSGTPLLEPAGGGLAERFADAVGATHPIRVFLVAALGGYALLVELMIAAGFLLTKVILPIGGVSAWDEHINRRLADGRTTTLIDLSWLGSTLAGGIVIPVLAGVLLILFLCFRHWRLAAFTLFVICIESGAYRATTLVVHRNRPDVHRLETLPVNASYPSGHTAASVAFLAGLLLVLASRFESLAVRLVLWGFAVAIPAFVIWSRMLRGMHHATDVAAGLLLGIGALCVTVFACRAAGAAGDRRRVTSTGGARW